MSRVAKNPVAIPAKVEVVLSANSIDVSGPLGKLSHPLTSAVVLKREVMLNTHVQCQVHCVL
jgi:large subunit ribosomal protein L6